MTNEKQERINHKKTRIKTGKRRRVKQKLTQETKNTGDQVGKENTEPEQGAPA